MSYSRSSSKLPTLVETDEVETVEDVTREQFKSMVDPLNCESNNDKSVTSYMLRLKEAINLCSNLTSEDKISIQKKIENEKEIEDIEMKRSMIIDKFLELKIHNEKLEVDEKGKIIDYLENFYNFYYNFIELEKQDDYKKKTPADKLLKVRELAQTEYPDFFTETDHRTLKQYIKQYIIDVNLDTRFPSLYNCRNEKQIISRYSHLIAYIEDIIMCKKGLSEDKKNLFNGMYYIYYRITEYELLKKYIEEEEERKKKATVSGGKKKSRRNPRKLNKRKSIRKKSYKRKRRTRKY